MRRRRGSLGRTVRSLPRAVTANGNDIIRIDPRIDIDSELHGESGCDWIFGGRGGDTLLGGQGGDKLWGRGGDDFLDGGDQSDFVFGGPGHDILLGGQGNDLLMGGTGRDLLIGGSGTDWVFGSGGDDLLITGTTIYDQRQDDLNAIRSEWTSASTYAERVEKLSGGPGPNLTAGVSVFDDEDRDLLVGNAGRDWFFAALGHDLVMKATNEDLVPIMK